jgi:LemA protein
MTWVLIVLLVVIVLIALALVALYNRLVQLRNRVDNAWAQIEVQLKRRHDLIPNLVETVKGYAAHERETFENVTRARAAAVAAQGPQAQSEAEGLLGQALGRLFAVAEAYPDLKANQNMMQLSEELTSTENKVAFARQAFNDAVMNYNNLREMFPNSVVAGMFMFTPAQLLEIESPEKRAVPQVKFT